MISKGRTKPTGNLAHVGESVTLPVAADAAPSSPQPAASPSHETTFRCYRYALRLTPMQSQALARATDQARRAWNELCALLKWAEREQRFGRREALLHAYRRLLDQKKRAGKAITRAHRLMEQHGLPDLDAAYAFARDERLKDVRRRLTPRQFAVEYALESMQSNVRRKRLCFSSQTAPAVAQKFQTAARLYAIGKRQRPRYKIQGDSVALQRQIGHGTRSPANFDDGTIDLSTVLGSVCGKAVRAVLHRPLPPGGQIKQIAIAVTPTRAYAVCMVEAPKEAFIKKVPEVPSAAVAGIDPGRTTALSVASLDGTTVFAIRPPLSRAARRRLKVRRLQRLADRQLHAANPNCRNKNGRWTKRLDKMVQSAGYRRTCRRIAEERRHLAAARREAYHLERVLHGAFGHPDLEAAARAEGRLRSSEGLRAAGSWRRHPDRCDDGHTEFYDLSCLDQMLDLVEYCLCLCGEHQSVARLQRGLTPAECALRVDADGNVAPALTKEGGTTRSAPAQHARRGVHLPGPARPAAAPDPDCADERRRHDAHPTPEGVEPPPKGDLTLRLINATGKLGVLNDTVPVAFLQVTRQFSQPASVTLQVHAGHLEGRLNGFPMDQPGFVLSAQQSP